LIVTVAVVLMKPMRVQWGIDTVYQEDYASLIDAAVRCTPSSLFRSFCLVRAVAESCGQEAGRRMTAAPQTAMAEAAAFLNTAVSGLQRTLCLSLSLCWFCESRDRVLITCRRCAEVNALSLHPDVQKRVSAQLTDAVSVLSTHRL
jgi:hypothetical protein